MMESSRMKTSKAKSGKVLDTQESSITQILSQRLSNMEQQLLLLRDDLKDAVETLKRKDQEITTLENKVALAERRRDADKKDGSEVEDLRDLSEEVNPALKFKQEQLQNECNTLSKKLQEMEKFFGDYGLAWVKEDALDETDQNNLWVRKTNIHYTPDFDKIFLVVEELNVGNAEPQVVKTGNTAQFKTAGLLHLTLYADGIQLENNPFRQYDSPSVEEFFLDLEDGYFPSELRGEHPEGVIFKVKDLRSTKFADDPNRRPTVKRDRSPFSPRRMSTPSTTRGPSKSSNGKNDKSGLEKNSSANGSLINKRSKTLSRKGSTASKRKVVMSKMGEPTENQKIADEKEHPQDSVTPTGVGVVDERDEGIKSAASPAEGTPKEALDVKGANPTEISPVKDGKTPKSAPGNDEPEGLVIASAHGVKINEGSVDGNIPSADKDPGNGSGNKKLDPQSTDTGLKQIFSADQSPQISSTRVPGSLHPNETKTELDKEQTKDSFGLPRPPLSPDGSSQVPKPRGPPSKHFENFFLNKVGETQTSGIFVSAQPPQQNPQSQPPPANVTNITYNEAPITIQMTPSELEGCKRKTAPMDSNICRVRSGNYHPKPCDCANRSPTVTGKEDGGLGTTGLIRPPGETEYREKYSENAVNLMNALRQKYKYQDKNQDMPNPPDPPKMGAPFDPNIQWPNFMFLGHLKGQEASPPPPTPVSPPASSKKYSDSPQIIHLNEKTSERMISVKMRTRSGTKEYIAHLYPKESVKRLRSLLKMHKGDKLIIEKEGAILNENTNVADISSDSGRHLVVYRYGDEKPDKTQYSEGSNLGSENPDLFKHYPGEVEVKNNKKPDEKRKISGDSLSSDDFSSGRGNSDDDKSRDSVVSPYKNRDWLSKEIYSRQDVPRATSGELRYMLDEFKRQENRGNITTTTLSDLNTRPTEYRKLAPKILSEDAVSGKSITNLKANYSSRKRKGLDNEKYDDIVYRPTVIPSVEKSRSSSMISESQVRVNSFVAEPRKKSSRRNIHENSSSLNIVEMDRVFPKRVPMTRGEKIEKQKSRDPSDTSIQLEGGKSHSLIFRRTPSMESSNVGGKESSPREPNIESIDTTPKTSKTSISYKCLRNSKSNIRFSKHDTSSTDGETIFDFPRENESFVSGLKIESLDAILRTSEMHISNIWSRNSKSNVSFTENINSGAGIPPGNIPRRIPPGNIKSAAGRSVPPGDDTRFDYSRERAASLSGLKIESLDTSLNMSKMSISRRRSKTSNSDVRATKTGNDGTPLKDVDTKMRNGKESSDRDVRETLSDRDVLEEDMKTLRRASSSGIRGDGFETATLLEMVDAMLRAQKEYEKDKMEKMGKDGVLLRKNSYSDDSITFEFVPPTQVLRELEELKKSLRELSRGSSSPHRDQEPDREFVGRLLEELLSKRCTSEEVIKKLEARRHGYSMIRSNEPESSSKPVTNDNRRGRMKKKPLKRRKRKLIEDNL